MCKQSEFNPEFTQSAQRPRLCHQLEETDGGGGGVRMSCVSSTFGEQNCNNDNKNTILQHNNHISPASQHQPLPAFFVKQSAKSRRHHHQTCDKRVTRHTSHVTRHMSHVTCHMSHVTRHTSHVAHHKSHVTRHTSHVTCNWRPVQTCEST